VEAGYAGPELKAEMDALQERKEILLAQLAAADEPLSLLHSSMADLYRTKANSSLQPSSARTPAWKPRKRSAGSLIRSS
jgi:hypothetical protein